VNRILSNDSERAALVRNARASVAERFSARRMVEELAAAYREIAAPCTVSSRPEPLSVPH
jgi:hypothetical protein